MKKKTIKKKKGKKSGRGRGQPTVITPSVIRLLKVSFENGLNVLEACQQAKISKTAYYDRCEVDKDFSDMMDACQKIPDIQAKNAIHKAIKKGDTTNSRWWLEKRQPKEFGPRIKHDGIPPADHRRFIIAGTDELPWLHSKEANKEHEQKAQSKRAKK